MTTGLTQTDPRFHDLLKRMGFPEAFNDPSVFVGIGEFLAMTGRPAEAIANLEEAFTRSPSEAFHPRWFYFMAMAHFAAARYREATDWANKTLQQGPAKYTTTDAHLLLATSHAHLGNWAQAERALAQGLRDWPNLKEDLVPLPVYTDHEHPRTVR